MRGLSPEDAARLERSSQPLPSPERLERAREIGPAEVAAYVALQARGVLTFEEVVLPSGRVVSVPRTNAQGRLALSLRACADWKVE